MSLGKYSKATSLHAPILPCSLLFALVPPGIPMFSYCPFKLAASGASSRLQEGAVGRCCRSQFLLSRSPSILYPPFLCISPPGNLVEGGAGEKLVVVRTRQQQSKVAAAAEQEWSGCSARISALPPPTRAYTRRPAS